MILDFEKFIKDKVGEALEGCFGDAMIYGTGYVKVVFKDGDLKIEHVPFTNIEKELEQVVELKNFIVKI